MKAIRFHQHGGPEVLSYEDCPDPVPGPGQALIAVKAVALNRLDLWVRQGIPAYPVTLPHILGSDIAGVIEGGELPPGFSVGDAVVVYPGISCGQCRACTAGLENRCAQFKIIGGHVNGGYAEKVVVPSKALVKKPANVDFIQAASFPLAFLTAIHMLGNRAQLKESETVLVLGAGSGIGTAAVQIAHYMGAHVIAATTAAEKVARIKALGADQVIVSHPQELASKVLELTHKNGVEVVFEHVGPATWEQSLKSVARGGRIVTCGATTGPEVPLILRQLFGREITLLGSMVGTMAEMQRVTKLVMNGTLKPVVDHVFPLKDAALAHEALLEKKHVGKLVLSV